MLCKAPISWSAHLAVPLCAPQSLHIRPNKAACKKVHQRDLRVVGINLQGNMLDPNEGLQTWEDISSSYQIPSCERAYAKLHSNISLDLCRVTIGNVQIKIFVHCAPLQSGDLV